MYRTDRVLPREGVHPHFRWSLPSSPLGRNRVLRFGDTGATAIRCEAAGRAHASHSSFLIRKPLFPFAEIPNVARIQRTLTRLVHGPHHGLWQNGMDQTARLAWGRSALNDPRLSDWLDDEVLFEQHGNGVVTLTPRLWERANPSDPQRGRLGGVMRWRHTMNSLYKSEVDAVIERLTRQVDYLGVVGDWNDVTVGRMRPSRAHLGFTLACVDPFDPDAIRRTMEVAGWLLSPSGWILPRHHPASRGHQFVIQSHAQGTPKWAADRFSGAREPVALEGPLAAMALVHRVTVERMPDRTLQLLDRLIDTFLCAHKRQQLEARARSSGESNKLRYVRAIFNRIFKSRTCASPESIEPMP